MARAPPPKKARTHRPQASLSVLHFLSASSGGRSSGTGALRPITMDVLAASVCGVAFDVWRITGEPQRAVVAGNGAGARSV